jgi:hypothetical protein
MSLNHVISLVARQQDIPPWLAQGIAANVGLSEAIRSGRRDQFPKLERAQNMTTLIGQILEREDREP